MATWESEDLHRQPPPSERLTGRVVIVTGGTRGIGAAISRGVAADGATVACVYAANRQRAEEFQAELARAGKHVSIHDADLRSTDDCRRLIEDVIELHGRIDVLVNNAGITSDRLVAKMTEDERRNVIDNSLAGPFRMAQAAVGAMVEQGQGRIVNVSSIIGQIGNVGQANYAAAKAALLELTMSLAKEAAFMLKRAGKPTGGPSITVNAVAPGFIDAAMLEMAPNVLDGIGAEVPLEGLGKADEVAGVVRFLASDAASYVNGQVWAINGGT